jgi:uncharacterized integral membrane protein (TIGR00698 family)
VGAVRLRCVLELAPNRSPSSEAGGNGHAPADLVLAPPPGSHSVWAIWRQAFAEGWAEGSDQALAAAGRHQPAQPRFELLVGHTAAEPEAAETAYRGFVAAVQHAPLSDFDRFVTQHAFWSGYKQAFDAILDQYTTPSSNAAGRSSWTRLAAELQRSTSTALIGRVRRVELYPGLLLAGLLGVLALVAARGEEIVFGAALLEPLVLALLFGMVVRNVAAASREPRRSLAPAVYFAGTGFAAKQLLEVAVGLLGASVDLRQVIAAGPALLGLIVAGVASGLIVSYTIGRLLGLGPRLATLVAVGNSICGNSAIAAVAPIVHADRREVASSVALTGVLGIGVVVTLPLLIPLLGLNHYEYGVLAGMGVYAVPQVIAAAFPVSSLSGEVGIFVKLGRVALLGPVVLVIALLERLRRPRGSEAVNGAGSSWRTYFPWFVLVFFGLGALHSLDLLPASLAQPTRMVSHGLTILAMAGLGFGVELATIRKVGPRIAIVVTCSLVFMISLALFLLQTFSITGAEPAQAFYLAPHCAPGERPEFTLGFRALKSQLGAVMGTALECAHTTAQGDAEQRTTRGLAYYRLASNTVGFTDGWERYALGSDAGVLYWTGPQVDPPPTAQFTPRF